MAQKKVVSIKDISEKCGVSIATVSRVMNNDQKVSEKTRRKVLEAIKKYGYVIPSPPAPEVKKVGIVIATETSDYYMALELQIRDCLRAAGIQAIMGSFDNDVGNLPGVLEAMYDSRLSGLILITCPYKAIENKLDSRIPAVWIDCNDPEKDTGEICTVQTDQYYSGMLAAQEFLRKGCVNPILLSGPRLSHRSAERARGFYEEYRRQGITLGEERKLQTGPTREILDECRQMVRYLLTREMKFDGVFAISDWRALGTYLACMDLGVRVPEDVKIIGYDGVSVASRTVLNITCIRQNIEMIARNATDLLLAQTRGETIEESHIVVPPTFVPGQTL